MVVANAPQRSPLIGQNRRPLPLPHLLSKPSRVFSSCTRPQQRVQTGKKEADTRCSFCLNGFSPLWSHSDRFPPRLDEQRKDREEETAADIWYIAGTGGYTHQCGVLTATRARFQPKKALAVHSVAGIVSWGKWWLSLLRLDLWSPTFIGSSSGTPGAPG